jgi:hypothetical protein
MKYIYIYIYIYLFIYITCPFMRFHVPHCMASLTLLYDITYPLMKLQLSRRPRRHIGRWSNNSPIVILVTCRAEVLRTGRFSCVEPNPSTRCAGSLAVPTEGMNELKKRTICYHCRGSHPSSSVVQPLAQSMYEFMDLKT